MDENQRVRVLCIIAEQRSNPTARRVCISKTLRCGFPRSIGGTGPAGGDRARLGRSDRHVAQAGPQPEAGRPGTAGRAARP